MEKGVNYSLLYLCLCTLLAVTHDRLPQTSEIRVRGDDFIQLLL